MAKTIKFNLICDGKPIRTLDDLRNNFCVEDIITYFHNGLLERWLTVRGFTEELAKLKAVAPDDDMKIIRELVKIFCIDDAVTDIERDTYIFTYKKEHKAQLAKYEAQEYKRKSIIDDYHAGYEALLDTIIDNKNDMPKIKAAVQEICEKYYTLFYMQSEDVLNLFLVYAPKAVFAMLMHDEMRKLYIPENPRADLFVPMRKDADDKHNIKLYVNDSYKRITQTLQYDKLKVLLGDNLKEFAGVTEGYWKDIEPKGKRFMILRMEAGNIIRPAGQNGADMSADDVNNKFLILDGIDYKSNSTTQKLLYVEV